MHALQAVFLSLPSTILVIAILFAFWLLAKSAVLLVNAAVHISTEWGLSHVVVGATIVSLGTTLPEMVVSVFSALQGKPELALGNAVGSIICDTGLILGLAGLIGVIPIDKAKISWQSSMQIGAGLLLVLVAFPYREPFSWSSSGAYIPQWAGFLMLVLLVLYVFVQIKLGVEYVDEDEKPAAGMMKKNILIMAFGSIGLAISAEILIISLSELAVRATISQAVVALTVLALGTSLPELLTSITAVRKGYGGIALGNIVGADILNVLFVVGVSASSQSFGLQVAPEFYTKFFPLMLTILLVLRGGIFYSKKQLSKLVSVILLALYIFSLWLSYAASF